MNTENVELKLKKLQGVCGCGNPAKYSIGNLSNGDFVGSCNKYRRCPSYDELNETLQEYRTGIYKVGEYLDTIDADSDVASMFLAINKAVKMLKNIGVAQPAVKPQYGKREDQY